MSESHQESITVESPPVLVEGNEYVEGYMAHRVPFMEVEDVDILDVLMDCKRLAGRPFDGDPNTAIALVHEMLNGASLPVTEQLSARDEARIFFGIGITNQYTAAYNHTAHNLDFEEEYRLIQLNWTVLESNSQKDPNEFVEITTLGDKVYMKGPNWFVMRQVGVEEGAHAAFKITNPGHRGMDFELGMNVWDYFINDGEYDGFLWRMIDAKILLEQEDLSNSDREGISACLELYESQKRRADRLRRRHKKNIVDVDVMKAKFFGVKA